MRVLSGILLMVALLFGCGDYFDDPSDKYPECIGIRDSFNPYQVTIPYAVTLKGQDTLSIQMFFTDYVHRIIPTDRYPTWHLWVGCTKKESSSTTRYYYDGFCNPNAADDKWYGTSGLFYHGEYANCDFVFDKLTCDEVSGSCVIITPPDFDSLHFLFTGMR